MNRTTNLTETQDVTVQHGAALTALAQGNFPGLSELDAVSDSWQRSAAIHRVNPESAESPRILTQSLLREVIEPIENIVSAAQPELDRIHAMVGQAGYATLFCDSHGVAIAHRGNEQRSSEFRRYGSWLGGMWGEEIEGTNGIGTAIAEGRPIAVHGKQHFRQRHINMSCAGAPVFDPDARLVALVDVTSIDPGLSAQAHALTLPLVTRSAQLIEERLFRERFSKSWILLFAPQASQAGALIAVDSGYCIVGADRHARAQFAIDPESMGSGISVWALFERQRALLQKGTRGDYAMPLRRVGTGDQRFTLVSPPLRDSTVHIGPVEAALLMQPRLDLLDDLRRRFAPEPQRGGLSPAVLRRVKDHIEAHLDTDLGLETLAALAGLSVHHFARSFRQSIGTSPHRFILQRRIKRAAELLINTGMPLSEIALSVGFNEASHFSRSFRDHEGLAPSEFRRLHR